jgi:hypothetical protein
MKAPSRRIMGDGSAMVGVVLHAFKELQFWFWLLSASLCHVSVSIFFHDSCRLPTPTFRLKKHKISSTSSFNYCEALCDGTL